MAQAFEILKKKELRGNIIEQLYRFYGEDINLSILKAALPLSGTLTEAEIKSAIYYLSGKDKEYVYLVFNKTDYMESLIWLTPRGVNLAEGDIEDIGVMKNE